MNFVGSKVTQLLEKGFVQHIEAVLKQHNLIRYHIYMTSKCMELKDQETFALYLALGFRTVPT